MRPFVFFITLCCLYSLRVEASRLVIIGDSISEGLGVSREQAYPFLLQKKFKNDNKNVEIVNAGVSGATTASAVTALKWQSRSNPEWVVIALGANDGLRGLPTSEIENNLNKAIEFAKAQKANVILFGMLMPPNYAKDYTRDFQQAYIRVAKKQKVPFYPFLLDGVAGHSGLNQVDGIHPNEKGHLVIADRVYRFLRKIL